MFGRLRQALEDALDRLDARFGPEAGEDVERILAAMREELIETKARIPELEALLERHERQRAAEKRRAEDCVRRASQAERIGDAETVEVAERFARQHLERVAVLERKIEATRADIAFHRSEAKEMAEQLRDAMARRDALGIQARRARAIERGQEAGEAASAFDSMMDRADRDAEVEAARRALDLDLEPAARDATSVRDFEGLDREANAERLLRELKRRMGVDPGEEG